MRTNEMMNDLKACEAAGLRLRSHTVHMENRSHLSVTGVTDVGCFNEHEAVLQTEAGDMVIEGENIHVTKLDLENGQVTLEGDISLIEYEEPVQKKKASLISRLFR